MKTTYTTDKTATDDQIDDPDPTYPVENLIAGSADPFHREIAESARIGGSHQFQRYYQLSKAVDGIVRREPTVEVYGREDSCYLVGDELDPDAYCISQFDVHELVRDILDGTDYVLTYVEREKLSESQAETVGVELDE